jgi:hypothetical protein
VSEHFTKLNKIWVLKAFKFLHINSKNEILNTKQKGMQAIHPPLQDDHLNSTEPQSVPHGGQPRRWSIAVLAACCSTLFVDVVYIVVTCMALAELVNSGMESYEIPVMIAHLLNGALLLPAALVFGIAGSIFTTAYHKQLVLTLISIILSFGLFCSETSLMIASMYFNRFTAVYSGIVFALFTIVECILISLMIIKLAVTFNYKRAVKDALAFQQERSAL